MRGLGRQQASVPFIFVPGMCSGIVAERPQVREWYIYIYILHLFI